MQHADSAGDESGEAACMCTISRFPGNSPHLSLAVIRGFLKWYALYKSTFYLLTLLTYRHSATENCDDAGYITDNTSAGAGPGPPPGNIPYIAYLIDANIQHSFPPRSTLTAVCRRFQLLARWHWTRSAVRMGIPMGMSMGWIRGIEIPSQRQPCLELTPGFYPGSNEQHRLF